MHDRNVTHFSTKKGVDDKWHEKDRGPLTFLKQEMDIAKDSHSEGGRTGTRSAERWFQCVGRENGGGSIEEHMRLEKLRLKHRAWITGTENCGECQKGMRTVTKANESQTKDAESSKKKKRRR